MKHVETLKLDPPRLVSSMVMIDREVWSTSSDSRVAVWNAETGIFYLLFFWGLEQDRKEKAKERREEKRRDGEVR